MSGTIRAGETIPKLRLKLPLFGQLWTKSGIKNDPNRVPARNDSAEDMTAAAIIVPARLLLTGLNLAFNFS